MAGQKLDETELRIVVILVDRITCALWPRFISGGSLA